MARTKRSEMLRLRGHGASVPPVANSFPNGSEMLREMLRLRGHGASVPPVANSLPDGMKKLIESRLSLARTNQNYVLRDRRLMRLGDLGEVLDVSGDLIPGLKNDFVLSMIIPLLSWNEFHRLSRVNLAWEQAIYCQLVQNARLSTHSAEILAVMTNREFRNGDRNEIRKVLVCSMKDKSWCELPPIPDCNEGFPSCCKCVSLQGKIYVLGGDRWLSGSGRREVYVCDLAGQRKWKRCANMLKPRQEFCAAVMGGKIYIFGGICNFVPDLGAEVYNPKADCWYSIKSMKSSHYGAHVAAVGDELVIHSGEVLINPIPNGEIMRIEEPNFLEVYHPGTDEWRMIKPFARHKDFGGIMVVAEGNYYMISYFSCDIYVCDIEFQPHMVQTWRHLQSSSFPGVRLGAKVFVLSCLAVDDEVLLLVSVLDRETPGATGVRLVQSSGFRQESTEVVWQILERPGFRGLDFDQCKLLCSAQL